MTAMNKEKLCVVKEGQNAASSSHYKPNPITAVDASNAGIKSNNDHHFLFRRGGDAEEEKKSPIRSENNRILQLNLLQTDNRREMSTREKRELMQNVFDKLEKNARITRLERELGLKETHLHAWLEAWEGPEQ